MDPMRNLLPALALSCLASLALAQPFPQLKGECLSGRQAELPTEALGRAAIIIMTFNREASEPATRWGKALDAEFKGKNGPAIYQVAQIEAAPRFVRPLILRSMRKKCDVATQDRFIVLKTDSEAWKKTAAFEEKFPDDAYLLLLDREGEIAWMHRSQGPDGNLDQLKKKLAALSLKKN